MVDVSISLEDEFWRWWWATSLSKWDRAGSIATGPVFLVFVPFLVRSLGCRPLPLFLLGLIGVEKMILFVGIHFNSRTYQRWRVQYLLLCRFTGTLTVAYVGSQYGTPGGSSSTPDVVVLISLLVILMIQPFVCMVGFKVQLLSQTVSLATASFFGLGLCGNCFGNPEWLRFFRACETQLDRIGTTLIGMSDSGEVSERLAKMTSPVGSPCRLIIMFVLLWVGWVIPSLLAYATIHRARLRFVMRSMRAHGIHFVPRSSPLSAMFWCFNGVFFFEVSWRVMKAVLQ
ncbi:hypothetical protein BSKO_13209 [Bryopsis sp. KO-2023]|nr:hypothetical protein BSKO_13209 [Bryopsis sp. KO-2023]